MKKSVFKFLTVMGLGFSFMTSAFADSSQSGGGSQQKSEETDVLEMQTTQGKVLIRLRPDLAPRHVQQIKTLVGRGFYDGVSFHRVIKGFMAQTGDPTGTGTGQSDLPDLPAEFSSVSFLRGVIGMARAMSLNSANSQFFICLDNASFLDRQYTVIGEVISGMEVVDKLKKGSADDNGKVDNPDKIVKLQISPSS